MEMQSQLVLDSNFKETIMRALKSYRQNLVDRKNAYDGFIFSALFVDQVQEIDQALQQINQQSPESSSAWKDEREAFLRSFWKMKKGDLGAFCGLTEQMELVEVRYDSEEGFILHLDSEPVMITKNIDFITEKIWILLSDDVGSDEQ